jgi:hypothetical protein
MAVIRDALQMDRIFAFATIKSDVQMMMDTDADTDRVGRVFF